MGRPRGFDEGEALQAALEVFWRCGYAATSLDDLTGAMGLSRSSFYGAFGSKHDVLMASLGRYVDAIFTRLQAIVAATDDPRGAVLSILGSIATPPHGEAGCLLVNAIAELAPEDGEVAALARRHVGRVVALIGTALVAAGRPADTAGDLAAALVSCAFGATTLRKAGLPAQAIAGLLGQVERLLEEPASPSGE